MGLFHSGPYPPVCSALAYFYQAWIPKAQKRAAVEDIYFPPISNEAIGRHILNTNRILNTNQFRNSN